MTDADLGRLLRALRRRAGKRQGDVAKEAQVSQTVVSDIENGRAAWFRGIVVRSVASVLGVSLAHDARWRGPALERLLDSDHAALVELIATLLVRRGWEILPEWTYNHFGERGSVDLVAWRAASRTLLVIEAKTRIVDVQDLMSRHDAKVRIATRLLRDERGWRAQNVGRVLVVLDTTANRGAIERHPATFVTMRARSDALRRWVRDPAGAISGIWFVSSTATSGAKSRTGGPERVRQPRPRSGDRDQRRAGGASRP